MKSATQNIRQQGVAMLVVMLVLLMVTATATFAAHSTSMDIRSSGHTRLAMQTHNLSVATLLSMIDYIDRAGPETVVRTIERSTTAGTTLNLTGLEPELATGKSGGRFYSDDIAYGGVDPVSVDVFGPRAVYEPAAAVDVYDYYRFTRLMIGQRADGGTPLSFVRMTLTSRARARIPSGSGSYEDSQQSASDSRAEILAGPTAL